MPDDRLLFVENPNPQLPSTPTPYALLRFCSAASSSPAAPVTGTARMNKQNRFINFPLHRRKAPECFPQSRTRAFKNYLTVLALLKCYCNFQDIEKRTKKAFFAHKTCMFRGILPKRFKILQLLNLKRSHKGTDAKLRSDRFAGVTAVNRESNGSKLKRRLFRSNSGANISRISLCTALINVAVLQACRQSQPTGEADVSSIIGKDDSKWVARKNTSQTAFITSAIDAIGVMYFNDAWADDKVRFNPPEPPCTVYYIGNSRAFTAGHCFEMTLNADRSLERWSVEVQPVQNSFSSQ
jgi:hypothetical protein